MPMLRAVPATTRKPASSEVEFKSLIFILTMSSTCLRVTLPTFSLLGVLDPDVMPAAFLSNTDAGGDLVMKVNDLSWNTVITTGITRPASALVAALNSLQNAMMLTPCWPSAGPTGGAGLAWPAGICNLICPVIFFAIFGNGVLECRSDGVLDRACPASIPLLCQSITPLVFSCFFDLPIFQFDGRVSPENVDR